MSKGRLGAVRVLLALVGGVRFPDVRDGGRLDDVFGRAVEVDFEWGFFAAVTPRELAKGFLD